MPAAADFLRALIADGGDAATAALVVMREAITNRPAVREPMLSLALDAAYGRF